jgi:predicted metal-binding membrane protein
MTARTVLWPAFFGIIAVAWVLLWIMGQEIRGYAVYGPEFWIALCRAGAADLSPVALFGMWAVMAAAMMLPTFVPALRAFLALPAPAGRPAEAAGLVAGYMAVWLVASAGLAVLQWALARRGILAPDGRSLSAALTAGLFLLAGAYQLTPVKAACLSHCRSPVATFLAAWRPGVGAALLIGLRLGRDCLGCCWALMLLALAGGMSNLLWMGLGTLLMTLEKLPQIGRPLTRPLGWALLAGGAVFAARAAGGAP